MAIFTFDNRLPKTVTVAVEPWAQVVQLDPQSRISIDYDEPAEFDVTLEEDGSVVIGVSTSRLRITAPGFDETFG